MQRQDSWDYTGKVRKQLLSRFVTASPGQSPSSRMGVASYASLSVVAAGPQKCDG